MREEEGVFSFRREGEKKRRELEPSRGFDEIGNRATRQDERQGSFGIRAQPPATRAPRLRWAADTSLSRARM